jgi:DNA primase
MSVVDEVKSKLDIVEYIGRTTPLKKAGRVYKACCPFHSERTPSFVVDPDKQTWRCFGACAEGGDIFNFVMKQQGIGFREALEELGKVAGVTVQPQTPEQKTHDEALDRLRGLLAETAQFFHEALMEPADAKAAEALAYARKKRALSDATLSAFGVGYAPDGWSNSLDHLTALGYSVDDIV